MQRLPNKGECWLDNGKGEGEWSCYDMVICVSPPFPCLYGFLDIVLADVFAKEFLFFFCFFFENVQ